LEEDEPGAAAQASSDAAAANTQQQSDHEDHQDNYQQYQQHHAADAAAEAALRVTEEEHAQAPHSVHNEHGTSAAAADDDHHTEPAAADAMEAARKDLAEAWGVADDSGDVIDHKHNEAAETDHETPTGDDAGDTSTAGAAMVESESKMSIVIDPPAEADHAQQPLDDGAADYQERAHQPEQASELLDQKASSVEAQQEADQLAEAPSEPAPEADFDQGGRPVDPHAHYMSAVAQSAMQALSAGHEPEQAADATAEPAQMQFSMYDD